MGRHHCKRPQFFGVLKVIQKYSPSPKALVSEEKIPPNEERHRKNAFYTARLYWSHRAQMRERDAGKLLKQRMRERMNPKLGRLDIDYQILHDAFFKHQTKPKMTIHGDLYHEGKENELKMRVYRPGQLSDELKLALGMPEGCPPPWIINMQRFGPPPAYPHLRIPGLNAPIPEGAQFGYQMGGWGNPESGIYGNTLNNNGNNPEIPNKKKHWGELEDEIEIEEESEGEESPEDTSTFIRNTAFSGFSDLTPLIIDQKQMIAGTQTTVGYETPAPVEIKKKINK
ncbi:unnamed protein product [Blepharisma stoltei]|uniref:PSP proline-rich domain-containing protein n=1 Tax=Blepharisma stoltei TaxID=1481888 RepID=A0AAU9IW36_9CILI|nr:unnamed protein product [Blepharisma stoltei]